MGSGSWSSSNWQSYAKTNNINNSTTQSQIFTQSNIHPDLDPKNFTNGLRESVDSQDNPNSTPIAIFTDVTGSMGMLATTVVKTLDTVCSELYDRKPVTDPHLMTGAVGDAYSDSSPFQATQFEADIRIAEQTQRIYIEGNGGGNGGESYALAWVFAALQTATDSFDVRNKKGYLFTVGDEPVHGVAGANQGQTWGVTKDQAKRFLNLDIERDLTADECLTMAQRKYNVFHIAVSPQQSRYHRAGVEATFGKIMPDNLIWLEDVKSLSEVIVSIIEVNEGRDRADVAASWSGDTSIVVANALKSMTVTGDNQEVVAL
jgi:hypothetical protein